MATVDRGTRRSADKPGWNLLSFADLPGWRAGRSRGGFRGVPAKLPGARGPARPSCGRRDGPASTSSQVCRAAASAGISGPDEARRFFEAHFQPMRVVPTCRRRLSDGLLRAGIRRFAPPDASYRVPLLDRPDDLVTVPQGRALPGLEPGLQAGRRVGKGYEPYPDRAAIEDGALGGLAKPVVYLREPGEAFIIHVQGSARIRLADGTVMRVAYAGAQRPSLYVHRQACWCRAARWTSKP